MFEKKEAGFTSTMDYASTKVVIDEQSNRTFNRMTDVAMSVTRTLCTSQPTAFGILVVSAYDSGRIVKNSKDLIKYDSEMTEFAKTNEVSKVKVVQTITDKTIKRGYLDLGLKTIVPMITNIGIRGSVDLNTPLKNAIVDANLPAIAGIIASEAIDNISTNAQIKKVDDASIRCGLKYYASKNTEFSKEKSKTFKAELITTCATSIFAGIMSYVSRKTSDSSENKTSVINIFTITPDSNENSDSKEKKSK